MSADAGDVLTGVAAVLGGSGLLGFIKWLFIKREGTVTRLEKRVAVLEEELREIWLAFAHVSAALHARAPDDPSLKVASRILKDKFPIDPDTPPDMRALLDKLK